MNKKQKKFDAVKMALDIKEAIYNENKDLSLSDYLKKISEEVHQSSYWKKKKPAFKSMNFVKNNNSKQKISVNKKTVS